MNAQRSTLNLQANFANYCDVVLEVSPQPEIDELVWGGNADLGGVTNFKAIVRRVHPRHGSSLTFQI